jgi:hypothetical protein
VDAHILEKTEIQISVFVDTSANFEHKVLGWLSLTHREIMVFVQTLGRLSVHPLRQILPGSPIISDGSGNMSQNVSQRFWVFIRLIFGLIFMLVM